MLLHSLYLLVISHSSCPSGWSGPLHSFMSEKIWMMSLTVWIIGVSVWKSVSWQPCGWTGAIYETGWTHSEGLFILKAVSEAGICAEDNTLQSVEQQVLQSLTPEALFLTAKPFQPVKHSVTAFYVANTTKVQEKAMGGKGRFVLERTPDSIV